MDIERNPSHLPLSNLILSDHSRSAFHPNIFFVTLLSVEMKSPNRISSFHSYASQHLGFEYFSSTYEVEEDLLKNQLLVDIQMRLAGVNNPPIFQTNNGVFSLVGSFHIDELEFVRFRLFP